MTICANTVTHGIDVSAYQVKTDWSKVVASGRTFAFVKYSEGTYYASSSFAADWAAAHAVGVLRGAYHFFRPEIDGAAQAKFFLEHIAKFGAGELPPVIDVETGTDMHKIGLGVSAWIDDVAAATGRRPLVYVSSGFWRVPTSYGVEAKSDLWVAQYPNVQPSEGGPWCAPATGAWEKWTFWQHWDKGQVQGVNGGVDVDVFNGSLEELREYAGGEDSGVVRTPNASVAVPG